MPEVNFNLLNPDAALYSGPNVVMDPQKAYAEARAQRQSNMLAQLYAKHYDPQTGGVNYNSLIGEAAQDPVTASAIPTIMGEAQKQSQSMAEIAQKRALQQQEEATAAAKQQEILDSNIKSSMLNSYSQIDSIETPEQYLKWHEATHADPYLSKYFEIHGIKKDDRLAEINSLLSQEGGLEKLKAQSKQGLGAILGIKPEEIKTAITEADGHRWLINEQTGAKIADLGIAAKTGTTLNVGTGKSIVENVGDIVKESRTKAVGSIQTMNNANQIRDALNSGLVIAGPLANVQMKWNQLMSQAGKADPNKVKQLEQTRRAITNLAKLTLAGRAQLQGSGAISDYETQLLGKAESGDINDMSVDELQTVVDAAQKGAQFWWNEHQGLLENMKSDPEAAGLIKYFTPSAKLATPTNRTAPAGGAKKTAKGTTYTVEQ